MSYNNFTEQLDHRFNGLRKSTSDPIIIIIKSNPITILHQLVRPDLQHLKLIDQTSLNMISLQYEICNVFFCFHVLALDNLNIFSLQYLSSAMLSLMSSIALCLFSFEGAFFLSRKQAMVSNIIHIHIVSSMAKELSNRDHKKMSSACPHIGNCSV